MIARVVAVALLLAGLVWWEHALSTGARDERDERTKDIGRLLAEEELREMPIAAVRLEWGDGSKVLYARGAGAWRCVLAGFTAPVDMAALNSLLDKITRAEGRMQSDDPAQAANYGISTRDTIRVSFCGKDALSDPTGDVLWSVDVGKPLPDGEGCFVRTQSSSEVWAIDTNPHAELGNRPIPHLPPLIDATVVSKDWMQAARGFDRVFVDRADGTSLEIRRRPKEVSEEEMRRGVLPYEFVLDPDSADPVVADSGLAVGYLVFLQKVTFKNLLDPRTAGQLGVDRWDARVTLAPSSQPGVEAIPPLELRILKPLPGGGVPVVNPYTNSLLEVDPTTIELFLPTREGLLNPAGGNPYEAWLQPH